MDFSQAKIAAESNREAVQQRVSQLLAQAEQAFGRRFLMPDIMFNQRGTIAGSARLDAWQLRFQPQLLIAHYEAFEQQIIPHEVAHLVVHQLFGRARPHGAEWRSVMQGVFKVQPRRTHNLTVEGGAGRRFYYQCRCLEPHLLTIRRHNRIRRAQASYRCKRCGSELVALIPQPEAVTV